MGSPHRKPETKAADAISLRERLKAGATKTMKDAYAAQTIVLAKALKDAKANTKAADAADEAALDEARTAVPDIHMIRGNCRRQAAS